jgi:hypothetical protein
MQEENVGSINDELEPQEGVSKGAVVKNGKLLHGNMVWRFICRNVTIWQK